MTAPTGDCLIGRRSERGRGQRFTAQDPRAAQALSPEFGAADAAQIDAACALAAQAAPGLRLAGGEGRARLLEAIVARLREQSAAIIARAIAECGLPSGRLEGEFARTTNQLLLFARVLRDGGYLELRVDPAMPARTPPRPDLRLCKLPLGPVAVFGASNFPLAFSVAGGDTASALAAGCPVVVKAHAAHPGTSELVGRAIQAAVADLGLHEGVFSLLFDAGTAVGAALVADARIRAVGFTGSRAAGMALLAIARNRAEPIPVYAEMSAINPVVLLPGALEARAPDIAAAFVASVTLGAGQFCTNPGLLLAIDGPGCARFAAATSEIIARTPGSTMLTAGIHASYCRGLATLAAHPRVTRLALGQDAGGATATPALFSVAAADFLADPTLHAEVFGACSLLVRCADEAGLAEALAALEGQLTLAIHAQGDDDLARARRLLPIAEQKAGRILFNGFGTGVEVCDAMVHGGPWPATSDPRSTSVGSLAIDRFLRPVCYQDVPDALLPAELQQDGVGGLPHRIDGRRAR